MGPPELGALELSIGRRDGGIFAEPLLDVESTEGERTGDVTFPLTRKSGRTGEVRGGVAARAGGGKPLLFGAWF